jgi:hypothetical protein
MKIQKFLLNFSFIVLFIFSATKSYAASGEFKTRYNVVYQISQDGKVIVDQEITLINQLTSLFATQSEITLGSANIYNISASDKIGKIYIKVNKENEETKVTAFFNEKVVGVGKKYVWHLRYETSDLVSLNGLIKEINIPKLELNPDIDDYTLTISVPESFGNILYIKPFYDKKTLFFNKDELSKSQISITFGEFQVFNFDLSYNIANTKITPVVTEIALPPDTSYQSIYLKTINPKPETIYIDPDGNWLARYQLRPNETINVTATGSAQIFPKPKYKEKQISFRGINDLLLKQKYWETEDSEIKKLAGELKTPQNIYNYVVGNLKYDYERVSKIPTRYGAKYALSNPKQAICMEFTDLFIAIARASGIMAREIDGYAFTNNSTLKPLSLKRDVLHAWPEYYDDRTQNWIQIDPTWENTTQGLDFFNTLDLNHLVFIRRGKRSDYPYPPGAYKDKEGVSKDVNVKFGNIEDIVVNKKIIISIDAPKEIYAGFISEARIIIENFGNTIQEKKFLNVKIDDADLIENREVEIGSIPPFGKKETMIKFKPNGLITPKNIRLSLFYDNEKSEKLIRIKPIKAIYLAPYLLAVMILILLTILAARKLWKH